MGIKEANGVKIIAPKMKNKKVADKL